MSDGHTDLAHDLTRTINFYEVLWAVAMVTLVAGDFFKLISTFAR